MKMLDKNRIYEGNHLSLLPSIDNDSIDLTITSPPYDHLRMYNGYEFNFKPLAKELYRITKEGGVVVWVVGDATINGSETGTSFRQALFFMDLFSMGIGFNLHDTMIYAKGGQGAVGSNLAYLQDFEYMFIFTKGKIQTFHPLIDRKNVCSAKERTNMGHRRKDGSKKGTRKVQLKEYGKRFNIWTYHECKTRKEHPAVFPEQLAEDHILSWSNEGDLVLDPMCGSGTTCKMAHLNNRAFIGIDISNSYCNMARRSISAIPTNLSRF